MIRTRVALAILIAVMTGGPVFAAQRGNSAKPASSHAQPPVVARGSAAQGGPKTAGGSTTHGSSTRGTSPRPANTQGGGHGAAKVTKPTSAKTTSTKTATKSAAAKAKTTSSATTAKTTSTTTLTPVQQKLQRNTSLASKLQSRLPAGTDLNAAALGFRNLGQFVAAVNVSNNLGIPFAQLKTRMVDQGMSLGQAIQDARPTTTDPGAIVNRAERDADIEIRATEQTTTVGRSKTRPKLSGGRQ